jgi:hypothetical protein
MERGLIIINLMIFIVITLLCVTVGIFAYSYYNEENKSSSENNKINVNEPIKIPSEISNPSEINNINTSTEGNNSNVTSITNNSAVNNTTNSRYSRQSNSNSNSNSKQTINEESVDNFILPDFEPLKTSILDEEMINDMPTTGSLSLKFFHTFNGEKVWDKAYYITKGSIEEKDQNADFEIRIPSKYVDELKQNLCDGIKTARNNQDIEEIISISETGVFLKYSGMLKYADCIVSEGELNNISSAGRNMYLTLYIALFLIIVLIFLITLKIKIKREIKNKNP